MRIYAMLLASAVLAGCGSGEPTVEVQIAPSGMYPNQYKITVAAIADQVTITGLTVNRGNCKPGGNNMPKQLGFGQTIDAYASNCNIKEVEVATDDGAYAFTFE